MVPCYLPEWRVAHFDFLLDSGKMIAKGVARIVGNRIRHCLWGCIKGHQTGIALAGQPLAAARENVDEAFATTPSAFQSRVVDGGIDVVVGTLCIEYVVNEHHCLAPDAVQIVVLVELGDGHEEHIDGVVADDVGQGGLPDVNQLDVVVFCHFVAMIAPCYRKRGVIDGKEMCTHWPMSDDLVSDGLCETGSTTDTANMLERYEV